ncbi:MAG: carbon-nitrogen family hydrolase [Chloroflexaceae bacterium]|nr:carbon-nitrogen family hydrolase [Chloroflexaceae bacterium]
MLHLALAQLDIYLGEPAINLDTARTLVATAAARGANLIVLPELWSTGYDLGRAAALADVPGEGMYADLAALAREQGIAIIGSTLAHHPDRPTNHATCYDATGQLLASYDKIHLFGLMHEDAYLQAGTRQGLFDAPWGRSALAICYDLRFPELFRSYAVQGAAIIFVPAEWPTPRIEHWRTLVRARAIENQCFMVAVNRVGRDHTNQFGGHSLVVDPWGTVLVEGDDTAALLFAQLDLATVEEVRSQMTTLRDRRPELY